MDVAVAENVLFLVGEPKSPHGNDVTPDGTAIIVGGKLDTHATVYDFAQMMQLIESQTFDGRDRYGIPILPFDRSIRGQVELGLGPLHTQFAPDGLAYTSMFLEPGVVRWNWQTLTREELIYTHYNIGHLVAAEGDTVSPDGHHLIAMNKWALDRFLPVGPLLPQNFQLIDISSSPMRLVYDLPIPDAEPHNAQMIAADKIHAVDVYSERGFNPVTNRVDPEHVQAEENARVEVRGNDVHVYMTAIRSHFTPDTLRVRQGQTVHLHLTNLEQAHDATHGFTLAGYNIQASIEPGEHTNIEFVASEPGVFPMYCTEFCSALHLEMMGYLLVEPAGAPAEGSGATL